jgi:hypothetical protein
LEQQPVCGLYLYLNISILYFIGFIVNDRLEVVQSGLLFCVGFKHASPAIGD